MSRIDERLCYFNPCHDVEVHHHVVPHWQQEAVTYFVTFRLADSIPQSRLEHWKRDKEAWATLHPRPWTQETELEYHQRFSSTLERWLDQSHGSCILQEPHIGSIAAGALQFFGNIRFIQHAFIIMPNHVHALFTPIGGHALGDILHSWKSFTSNEINKEARRSGPLWQKTYFDRIIRDAEHFKNCVRYIRRNPQKARLQPGRYVHFESAWVADLGI